jgi:hypothetical protein
MQGLIGLRNIHIEERSARDINNQIDLVHRDLGYVDGKVNLIEVRELLKLDLKFYQLDDPGLIDEVVHKLKIGAKQIVARPQLLLEAVRKFDLSALYLPDQKRIYIDHNIPELKKRWCESHEISHSLIPWHEEYMHGDDKSTLSPGCHEIIEAEANYGGGRLLFPHKVFSEARQSSKMSLSLVKAIATNFGNTITSTLWRCVEQSEEILFATIGGHPHHPKDDVKPIEYLIGSKIFTLQFANISEEEVWAWILSYCRTSKGGPLGQSQITIVDKNNEQHIFLIESFSNGHNVLTLGRWVSVCSVSINVSDFQMQ